MDEEWVEDTLGHAFGKEKPNLNKASTDTL